MTTTEPSVKMFSLLGRKITSGPNRDRLFDLLRLRNELKDATETFEVEDDNGHSMTLVASIHAIENEGAGPHWFLTVHFREVMGQLKFSDNLPSYVMFYDSQVRRGGISIGMSLRQLIWVDDNGNASINGTKIAEVGRYL